MTSRGSSAANGKDDINPEFLVPGKEWRESLNATCNRLSTQYLQLLKAAAAATASTSTTTTSTTTASTQSSSILPSVSTSSSSGIGPATNLTDGTGIGSVNTGSVAAAAGQPSAVGSVGTGTMTTLQDPPPPALAYEVIRSQLSCQLATENLCVAASQLLTLIRQLRLSILITDTSTMTAEEVQACQEIQRETERATQEAKQLEEQWIQLRNNAWNGD